MQVLMAVVVGVLFATGLYMIMRRSLIKMIIGLAFLSYSVNLMIFTIGRLKRGKPPLIQPGESQLVGVFADPVPQALILTAIVIGFGVLAFAVVLIKRTYQSVGTADIDKIEARS